MNSVTPQMLHASANGMSTQPSTAHRSPAARASRLAAATRSAMRLPGLSGSGRRSECRSARDRTSGRVRCGGVLSGNAISPPRSADTRNASEQTVIASTGNRSRIPSCASARADPLVANWRYVSPARDAAKNISSGNTGTRSTGLPANAAKNLSLEVISFPHAETSVRNSYAQRAATGRERSCRFFLSLSIDF